MDYSSIVSAIGSLGFPIVACIALYYSSVKENERHKEEMDKITDALNNNTVAITQLSEKLNNMSEGVK